MLSSPSDGERSICMYVRTYITKHALIYWHIPIIQFRTICVCCTEKILIKMGSPNAGCAICTKWKWNRKTWDMGKYLIGSRIYGYTYRYTYMPSERSTWQEFSVRSYWKWQNKYTNEKCNNKPILLFYEVA